MLRLHFACLLFDAMLTCATIAAPVPKQAPKEGLTADALVGGWNLKWGDSWGEGAIVFSADGTYVCVKTPRSFDLWYGRWTVKDGTLTLVEYVHDEIGDRVSGPFTHVVPLETAKGGAELVGTANGNTPVRMWGRTK